MNFNQLEYILEVANEKSISKAAEKIHISPSAISQSIAQLEKELNITIFHRDNRGAILTPQGRILADKAHDILNNLKELHHKLNQYEKSLTNHLKVSFTPAISTIVHQAILKISDERDDITFELEESDSIEIIKSFNNTNTDLAFLSASKNELEQNHLKYEHLHIGYPCIVVGKKSTLYNKDFVTLNDLVEQKFIFHRLGGKSLQNAIKMNGNKVFLYADRGSALIQMVADNKAISVGYDISLINYPKVLNGELKVIPIKNSDLLYQDFWVLHSYKQKSDIANLLISYVKSILLLNN
ncbi:LysR family transcriptional regulator [Gottfriedia acidiceleris]|uniref:LysR family transcriptional regulator n=1 Tax=Gottfriedia acidiceleris TaxID=371036 RepID=UPI00101BEB52|nr:LysR family transcriptional regulator [Gottfriedia acidiceleris]